MGEHQLRDLACKEQIYQLTLPGLPARFPPLNTLDIAFRRGLVRAAAVAAVIVAVVSLLALTAVRQARRAVEQQHRAEQREQEVRHDLYAADMNLAQQAYDDGTTGRMKRLLEQHRPVLGQPDLRGFEWRYLWRLSQGGRPLILRGLTGGMVRAAFSPDGRRLATASTDQSVSRKRKVTVRLWGLPTRGTVGMAQGRKGPMTAAAQRVIASLEGGEVEDIAFSPDGNTLALVGTNHTLKLWSLITKKLAIVPERLKDKTLAVAFSPDGRTIATGSQDGTAMLWDLATKRATAALRDVARADDGPINALAFSPDGKILAMGTWSGAVEFWNIATGREVAPPLVAHAYIIRALAFSPDGKTLVTAGQDNNVRLWNTTTWRYMLALKGHKGSIYSVAFAPNGDTLATAGEDETVRLWPSATLAEADAPKLNRRGVKMAEAQPIVKIAHTIIQQAIKDGASEVRIGTGPKRQGTWVSFVIQGVTHGVMELPGHTHPPLIARYKEMADMDANEQSAPQHGRIAVSHSGKDYDLDVHSKPHPEGEQIWFTIQAKE